MEQLKWGPPVLSPFVDPVQHMRGDPHEACFLVSFDHCGPSSSLVANLPSPPSIPLD